MTTPDTQPNPLMQILQMMNGFWMTQCIGVAAQLGVADHLIGGAITVETLAESLSVDAQALYRLLRALASAGIFSEAEPRQFQLTSMAECLRSDAPNSIRELAIWSGSEPTHWQMWGNLLYSVKTGKPAFEHVTGMPIFAYAAQNPEFAGVFDQAMTSASAIFNPAIAHAYDFSLITTLVDIGGGQGAFLSAIMQANPHLNGIVYDLPHVIEGAKSYLENLGLQNRCRAIGGNFLESVPEGGDAYNYNNLPEDILKQLALGDELFIATSALVELRLRESIVAAIVADEILSKSKGDKYLQATALSVLFGTNQEQAINYMLKEAPSCELYILNTIMELMIENESDFASVPASLLAAIVKERLQKLENSTKFMTLEVKDKFLHIY